MATGETRRFWIPEPLAYGGRRDPKGMLVFDIELLKIQ
jgi:FKBP-type peptidyl-prolyl cis-trans isomerase